MLSGAQPRGILPVAESASWLPASAGRTQHAPELLEFEEPVGVLLKEIEALSMLPQTPERAAVDRHAAPAGRRDPRRAVCDADAVAARARRASPSRPNTLDYVERLFTGFDELHGDRRFADDHAIVCGFADYKGQPVCIVGHQKGQRHEAEDLPELRLRASGGISEGAARDAAGAEVQPPDRRLHRYPGGLSRASNRKSAASPRRSRSTCARWSMLEVPIVVIVCGEGGSGGALGHRDRRPGADAGVRGLQRHPAGGMRGDPLARRKPQGGGRRGAEDHGARSAAARV